MFSGDSFAAYPGVESQASQSALQNWIAFLSGRNCSVRIDPAKAAPWWPTPASVGQLT